MPTGNTEIQFKAGGLNFHSDVFDWLVVNQGGKNAQFKGAGMINSEAALNDEDYRFMIWAKDLDPDDPSLSRLVALKPDPPGSSHREPGSGRW